MNLVQFIDQKGKRRAGLVVGASIIVLKKAATTLDLARLALAEGKKLAAMASSLAGTATEGKARADPRRSSRPRPLHHHWHGPHPPGFGLGA